jgi:poly(hydroxyalkanoate) granule-associated protein
MARKKSSQQEVIESAHKVWLAGLGAMALAGEEGKAMFQALVEKGEDYEQRGRKQVDRAKGKVKDARAGIEVMVGRFSEKFDDSVAGALQRLGVPTRKEIATLSKRVEDLTKSIERMKPAARKPAARKPAAKKPAAKPTSEPSA